MLTGVCCVVGVDVDVSAGVTVAAGGAVAVSCGIGVCVSCGTGVGVLVGTAVGVDVSAGVEVSAGVDVAVAVLVGICVEVTDGVGDGTSVSVGVGEGGTGVAVAVNFAEAVAVEISVGIGVADGTLVAELVDVAAGGFTTGFTCVAAGFGVAVGSAVLVTLGIGVGESLEAAPKKGTFPPFPATASAPIRIIARMPPSAIPSSTERRPLSTRWGVATAFVAFAITDMDCPPTGDIMRVRVCAAPAGILPVAGSIGPADRATRVLPVACDSTERNASATDTASP
ncbi:MAG: hypothetical protein JWO42_3974 [Chloroflexi bacterium]|nr:hypothetical protein [Chloroflexota bacterium]